MLRKYVNNVNVSFVIQSIQVSAKNYNTSPRYRAISFSYDSNKSRFFGEKIYCVIFNYDLFYSLNLFDKSKIKIFKNL